MRLSTLALASLVLLLPAAARAASTPPGLNIRWDQCYGDGGVANKNFACDTNSGSERLVASFELSAPFAQVAAAEMKVNIVASSATLPSWWLYNVGACRGSTSFAASGSTPGSVNCADWASGAADHAIPFYEFHGPNWARMDWVSAVQALENAANLQPNQEYWVFQMTINHAKTVGTGACAGCETPVCINFERLKLSDSGGISLLLDQGANTDNSRFVTWQGGAVQNVHTSCGPNMGCVTLYDCANSVTPTRGSTWGAVKSLYR